MFLSKKNLLVTYFAEIGKIGPSAILGFHSCIVSFAFWVMTFCRLPKWEFLIFEIKTKAGSDRQAHGIKSILANNN
jgi:hypothetical protein